jgi:hypothetical protein
MSTEADPTEYDTRGHLLGYDPAVSRTNPRVGLGDLGTFAPARQAQRDYAAGEQLARIAAGIDELVAIGRAQLEAQQRTTELLHYLATHGGQGQRTT